MKQEDPQTFLPFDFFFVQSFPNPDVVRECREKEDDHTECVLSFLKNHFEKAILIPRRVDRKLLMFSQRGLVRNLIQKECTWFRYITKPCGFFLDQIDEE